MLDFIMLSFMCTNAQALTNSVGLVLDIVGAWLVAWEVVRQFHGKKVDVQGGVLVTNYLGSDGTPVVAGQQTKETNEFMAWETKKYLRMKWGLCFLSVGFVLQIMSNWIPK